MDIQPQPQVFDVDETNFEELVIKGSSERVIVVDFWAPWCGPCKTLGPVLEEVVSELGPGIALAKINVDDNQQLAQAFKVQGIPAVKIVKDGQLAQEFTGALPKDQIDAILRPLVGDAPVPEAEAAAYAADGYDDHDNACDGGGARVWSGGAWACPVRGCTAPVAATAALSRWWPSPSTAWRAASPAATNGSSSAASK